MLILLDNGRYRKNSNKHGKAKEMMSNTNNSGCYEYPFDGKSNPNDQEYVVGKINDILSIPHFLFLLHLHIPFFVHFLIVSRSLFSFLK